MRTNLLLVALVSALGFSLATADALTFSYSPSASRNCGWFEPPCYDNDACTDRPGECIPIGGGSYKTLRVFQKLYRCGTLTEVQCWRVAYLTSNCTGEYTVDTFPRDTCGETYTPR